LIDAITCYELIGCLNLRTGPDQSTTPCHTFYVMLLVLSIRILKSLRSLDWDKNWRLH